LRVALSLSLCTSLKSYAFLPSHKNVVSERQETNFVIIFYHPPLCPSWNVGFHQAAAASDKNEQSETITNLLFSSTVLVVFFNNFKLHVSISSSTKCLLYYNVVFYDLRGAICDFNEHVHTFQLYVRCGCCLTTPAFTPPLLL
jgi:hypothetical protein